MPKRHTKKWKEQSLAQLKELAEHYPVVSICSLEGTPAKILQTMRKKLAGKAVIITAKKRIIEKMVKETRLKETGLEKQLEKGTAIIFSKMPSMELAIFLKKNSIPAMPKQGQLSPIDITVPAGDTGLAPGPALSDLKAVGINAKIQGASIFIQNDTVICRQGQPITKAILSVLTKLDIKPTRIGMALKAAIEENILFTKEALNINPEETAEQIAKAYNQAMAIALESQYFTPKTTELLIAKSVRQANAISEKI